MTPGVLEPLEISTDTKTSDRNAGQQDAGVVPPSGLSTPDTIFTVADFVAAHEVDGRRRVTDRSSSKGSSSFREGSFSDGSDLAPTLRRYRPDVHQLRTELERLQLASEMDKPRGTRSLPMPNRSSDGWQPSIVSDGDRNTVMDLPGGLVGEVRIAHPSLSRSHTAKATFVTPGGNVVPFSLPFIVEEFHDDVDSVPERPFSAPESRLLSPPVRGPNTPISYEDFATFRPYVSGQVPDSDRLSVLSYPGSTIIPLTQYPSTSSSTPSQDILHIPDSEGKEFEIRLSWKSATEATYKELMGILGTDELRIQRGWEYKQKDVDSLQWSITYVPRRNEGDPGGSIPRVEFTIFYNSIALFLVASQSTPRKLQNLRVPTFVADFVEPLSCPTEWAQIDSVIGPFGMPPKILVGMVVKAQGDLLNDRCRKFIETWTTHGLAKARMLQSGLFGRATSVARVLSTKVHGGGMDQRPEPVRKR
ncbi:hypothetical protein M427DRAFT_154877 [Gonapodya prolifera JEL478]|uniref:Uncharacterized protein n=1 Tax=Gonapodya prolifera (strain JEL478) TaxID=1344416 RepID=A0A139AHA0_GONPJ|nr:hypothetical protein M427DRAFT_154877 [Gonapodya prolifera JEL478]|eukprot:KXS16167.1 hypothetical protein M427DRAFT_154877 [Gonapodya prolifera JEL478]